MYLHITYLTIITAIQRLSKQLDEWRHCEHINIVPFLGLLHREGNVSSLVIPYYENMDVMSYLRSNPTADKLLLVSKLPDVPMISVDVQVTDYGFGFRYCLFTRPRDNTW